MKKSLFGVFIIVMLFTNVASAATGMSADELRAEIARLSRVAESLRAQLLVYGDNPATVLATNEANAQCLQTNKQMWRRHEGGSVSALQQFLVYAGVYDPTLVTGYFGPATEVGVQAWQSNNGIVSSGTPESTGYGRVGPGTLRAMHVGCLGGVYTGTSGTLTGGYIKKPKKKKIAKKPTGVLVEIYALSIKPTKGLAPMTVTAGFTIAGSTCTSYVLDWGDGELPVSYDSGKSTGCTSQAISITKTHVYKKPGNHIVRFKTGKAPIIKIKEVSTVPVTVQGLPSMRQY